MNSSLSPVRVSRLLTILFSIGSGGVGSRVEDDGKLGVLSSLIILLRFLDSAQCGSDAFIVGKTIQLHLLLRNGGSDLTSVMRHSKNAVTDS